MINMKNIIAATDFTETSEIAVVYAAELAKETQANLVILYAYEIPPVSPAEMPSLISSLAELENEGQAGLEKMKSELLRINPELKIELKCINEKPKDAIESLASEYEADLIVVGLRDQTHSYSSEDNVAVALMKYSEIPVLAINGRGAYKPLRKILLAYDYADEINSQILYTLKELVRVFNAHVYVFNISQNEEMLAINDDATALNFSHLENSLTYIKHSYHFTHKNDVVRGINEYAAENGIDLVVMLHRDHSVLEEFTRGSNTLELAESSSASVLSLKFE